MAKITLSDATFQLVPEGKHIFKIESVTYKEDFGKLEIVMKTAQGLTHIERFTFVKNDGSVNDVALGVFSFFAKTALNDFDRVEIDHEELVGKYIECEVTHEKVASNKDPNKILTFSRLGNKYPADGFTEPEVKRDSKIVNSASSIPNKKVDLSSILGLK